MNNDDNLLRPELGEQVMNVLSRLQSLPEKGIIAGQAVASAIDEILGTGTPVYNDIDCFRTSSNGEIPKDTEQSMNVRTGPRLASTVTYSVSEGLDADAYSQRLNVLTRNLYQVMRVEEQGLLNNVDVHWLSSNHFWLFDKPTVQMHDARQLDLIRVFDLNNVQASVDLSTGRLVVTDAFREFFRTRQMRLSNLFTPVHTALRLVHKAQELSNVYADLEGSLKMLNAAIRVNEGSEDLAKLRSETMREGRVFLESYKASEAIGGGPDELKGLLNSTWLAVGEGLTGAPLVFGRKYFKRYERHADVLRRHLAVQANARETLFLAKTPTSSVPLTLPALSLEDTARLAPPDRAAARLSEQLLRPGAQLVRRRQLLRELLSSLGQPQERFLRKAYAFHGDAYLEGFDSVKEAQGLIRLHQEHVEFNQAASALPLGEQLRVARALRRAFKDRPAGWGLLSGYETKDLLRLVDDPEFLAEELATLTQTETPLVSEMPLPSEVLVPLFDNKENPNQPSSHDKVFVRELRSQADLQLEGTRMGHCVGGYGRKLAEGDCRIISMFTGPSSTDSATIEWAIREKASVRKEEFEHEGELFELRPLEVLRRQVQGRENSIPKASLTYAEVQVREELNNWLNENVLEGWKLLAPHRLEFASRAHDAQFGSYPWLQQREAEIPW